MTRWSQDELDEFYIRRQDWTEFAGTPDAGPEKVLQAKCIKYCDACGWLVFHDWSKKSNTRGWPDLIIFMANGRVELIELKSAGGKLRSEQQALHRQLMFLKHKVHVVKSYKRFIQIMKEDKCK